MEFWEAGKKTLTHMKSTAVIIHCRHNNLTMYYKTFLAAQLLNKIITKYCFRQTYAYLCFNSILGIYALS